MKQPEKIKSHSRGIFVNQHCDCALQKTIGIVNCAVARCWNNIFEVRI
jgi:hypothetical protein